MLKEGSNRGFLEPRREEISCFCVTGSMGGVTWKHGVSWLECVVIQGVTKFKNLMQWRQFSCMSDAVREKRVLFMKLCVSDVFRGVLA